MIISESVLEELLKAFPQVRPQIYFKSSLTALSHAMEDQVLAGVDRPLVIASFQRERFYRQEAHRYLRIAERTDQVYVLAAPETDFVDRQDYETIAFQPADALSQEWHLVVLGAHYASCLICRERQQPDPPANIQDLHIDQSRRFEGIWTFDRQTVYEAANLLLKRIQIYRPDLAAKTELMLAQIKTDATCGFNQVDPGPFAERLVTYLQAGQYKLAKAYRSIAEKERKERLINSITAAVRRSLNPNEILQVAVQELGKVLGAGRCLIYRCKSTDETATLEYEFLGSCGYAASSPAKRQPPSFDTHSLVGQSWSLRANPLFQEVVQKQEPVYVEDTHVDERLRETQSTLTQNGQIRSWLMVPVLNQNQLLGIVELHYCSTPHKLERSELEMVEAIATQIGVALIQAEAYANLEDLNQQLAALDRTRSNLIAITGHELRTPLSTIQVCLESLASEPDMSPDLRQVMLNSALTDSDRMRKLIQDFLTLSRLESGRIEWRLEPLPLEECVDLALSSLQAHKYDTPLPKVTTQLPSELPLVQVDGEWLVEVISKLLDNACKFTDSTGQITIEAQRTGGKMLEVIVADTGRGIESNRLETVFDRFYQEEGALRRTTGGTGLGLAICRQIIAGWGGRIWAESGGKDQGTQVHFTIPIVQSSLSDKKPATSRRRKTR
ncbi:histidine kinase [Phormidesmis priestleyi ULC007]|uniref:histidine kinase n=1 Tax=Phormidesmis priestleyi ULC007 TaxID=1920490 RepID=A0A2T1D6L6_9CYAN|nr:DICT sensory domain-containing protein [Phormidesmis priestleyi]PSB16119.1 histidine kinase [Phormidesmis priestleyi ULC007]PZO50493.1 MAG: histidine kinase [Phormidesmis priestleyi]